MSTDPIHNPGVGPIQPAQEPSSSKPMLGAGEEAGPKPFSLPPEPLKGQGATAAETEKMSPMDLAREGGSGGVWSQDQMSQKLSDLKDQFSTIGSQLQNPSVTSKFSSDHYTAMGKAVDLLNPDMRTISKTTGQGDALPAQRQSGQGLLDYVTNWINGSQVTLNNALNYVGGMQQPNPVDYLKLQMGVQRATQRGELFASIIGASVSGIKTIMSTQLG